MFTRLEREVLEENSIETPNGMSRPVCEGFWALPWEAPNHSVQPYIGQLPEYRCSTLPCGLRRDGEHDMGMGVEGAVRIIRMCSGC